MGRDGGEVDHVGVASTETGLDLDKCVWGRGGFGQEVFKRSAVCEGDEIFA